MRVLIFESDNVIQEIDVNHDGQKFVFIITDE